MHAPHSAELQWAHSTASGSLAEPQSSQVCWSADESVIVRPTRTRNTIASPSRRAYFRDSWGSVRIPQKSWFCWLKRMVKLSLFAGAESWARGFAAHISEGTRMGSRGFEPRRDGPGMRRFAPFRAATRLVQIRSAKNTRPSLARGFAAHISEGTRMGSRGFEPRSTAPKAASIPG